MCESMIVLVLAVYAAIFIGAAMGEWVIGGDDGNDAV